MTKKKKPAPASKSKVKTIKKTKPLSKKPSPRTASAKKPAAKKAAKPKPLPKKQSVKNPPKKSSASAAKPAKPAKAAPAAKVVKAVTPPPAAAKGKAAAKPPANGKQNARTLLRNRILGKAKASKPIAFSLDEVREIAKTVAEKGDTAAPFKPSKVKAHAKIEQTVKPAKPHHVKAASLADVLGFNPKKSARATNLEEAEIPDKLKRYYKLLVELRNHVTGQLDQHTEETLKRSSKEDSGDLSSYGQHMADAGTDTFDRDFALSLVSNEQEALSEIEAAIQRIKAGTYGVCEITQKPIARERLLAVPFTRHSTEAQKQIERNRHRTRTQAGLFESGEDGAKMASDDGDDD